MLPGWEGNINVKWLRRLKFGDQPFQTREETSKYTDPLPDSSARQFTFPWKPNRRSPGRRRRSRSCPDSVRGRSAVSPGQGRDASRMWRSAPTEAKPGRTRSCWIRSCRRHTRFVLPWTWDGSEAILTSRATDETGYVQPTRDDLLMRAAPDRFITITGSRTGGSLLMEPSTTTMHRGAMRRSRSGSSHWRVHGSRSAHELNNRSRRGKRSDVLDTGGGAATRAPGTFGFGRSATADDIAEINIDVRPDGAGLPGGSGTAAEGAAVFMQKCSACHGANGEGSTIAPRLIDPTPFRTGVTAPTVGNYWPYATTVWDYINRAMPFDQPGSLSAEEVYHSPRSCSQQPDHWRE